MGIGGLALGIRITRRRAEPSASRFAFPAGVVSTVEHSAMIDASQTLSTVRAEESSPLALAASAPFARVADSHCVGGPDA